MDFGKKLQLVFKQIKQCEPFYLTKFNRDSTTTTTHQTNPDFHHQLAGNTHFLPSQTTPLNAPPPPRPVQEANGEGYSNGGFCSQPMVAVPYENESDPNRSRSDTAIACLLDAYLDKFMQLNRGNLRGRDWEEVARIVSERSEKQTKSVEQAKNKVDNLKKRYKLERRRMMNTNGGNATSHWPWFKKMEQIVGNSLPLKTVLSEENSAGGMSSPVRHSKRIGGKNIKKIRPSSMIV